MAAHRKLATPMRIYRIGDPKGAYPIFSGKGAVMNAGRWHDVGQEIIYCAEHYSTAMLERLVHYSGALPKGQHFIEITIPAGTSYEEVLGDAIPGWYQRDSLSARTYGADWFAENRSAILIVPSVVARMEKNVLLNTQHADFAGIEYSREYPVTWDDRLFNRSPM